MSMEKKKALAIVAQWVEWGLVNKRVAGLILSPAHVWVAGRVPRWGRERSNRWMYRSHLDVSPLSKKGNFKNL